MAGMDILVIGIADEDNLDDVAPVEDLNRLFVYTPEGEDDLTIYEQKLRLSKDPGAQDTLMRYLSGENELGSVHGVALGYLAKRRSPDDVPELVPPQLLARIPELCDSFRAKMKELGLNIGNREVGLWMVNIRDT